MKKILFFILVFIIIYSCWYKTEKYEKFTTDEITFAQNLKSYLTTQPKYFDYLDYLNDNKNKSSNLIKKDYYLNLINNKNLTVDDITKIM
jgi:hypothetical protein|uniref:Lipoprotein n=1 Tax=viral metagenome TaxID=1070528 RepID=A0A6C0EDX3_9ZZZZ